MHGAAVDLAAREPENRLVVGDDVGGGPITSSTTMALTEPVPITAPVLSNSSRSMLNAVPRVGPTGRLIDLRRVVKVIVCSRGCRMGHGRECETSGSGQSTGTGEYGHGFAA